MKNLIVKRRNMFVTLIMAVQFAAANAAFADVPFPPQGVSPDNTIVNGSVVSFNWYNSGGATYYQLQLSPDPAFNELLMNKVEDMWTTDIYSPLPDNGGTYYWRVFACNGEGCSYSARSFTNGPSAQPVTPYLQSPADNVKIDGPSATFDWADSARAVRYYFQIAYDTGFHNIHIDSTTSGSSATVTHMPDNGLTYYWRACAYNSLGTPCATYRTITSGPSAAPATPTLSWPWNGSTIYDVTTGAGLEWYEADRAADYYLEMATDNKFTNNIFGQWIGYNPAYGMIEYNNSGLLDNGRTYYWRVKARNSLGESAFSLPWSFVYYDVIEDVTSCTSYGNGSGIGVTNNLQNHIDTCRVYDSGKYVYWLYDISRRTGVQANHDHDGEMKSTAAIKTKYYNYGVMNDTDNVWSNDPDYDYRPGVDAHVYAAKVYDYLYNAAKGWRLNSYDGTGSSMVSTVDIPAMAYAACQDINAFWYDGKVNYCAGINGYNPYSGALDVVAHEWGHAVTAYAATGRTGELKYEYQSGALNEAFSDWMGTAVEQYSNPTNWNWQIGRQEIEVLRDLSDPSLHTSYCVTGGVGNDQPQPDHMSGYIACSNDNGGVHLNSGIPNKMFYLLAADGDHTHPISNITVQGLGIEKAMAIAYRANMEKWRVDATFQNALDGMIDSATKIANNNPNSNEVYQVKNAWAAVGVGTLPTISTYTNLSGSGATTGDGSFEWGISVTVTATAAPGYYFINWTENGTEVSALATYNFAINGSRSLVANFAAIPSTGNISYTSSSFINTYVGDLSPPTTFTVKNGGLASFTVSNVSITGTNPQDFTVSNTGSQDYCGGKTLTTFATCTVQAKFSPQSAGSKAATLNIQSSAAVNSLLTAPLSGTGQTPPTYTVTPSAGANGSFNPSTAQTVSYNGTTSFTLNPADGYHIASVTGCSGSLNGNTYTIGAVTANCTVTASFSNTLTITATAGSGGTISPIGATTLSNGGSQTYTITPNTGYHILDVKVDGVSQGAWSSYSFNNVSASHAIEASFAINTYIITTTASSGGNISPSGAVIITSGANQTFVITPDIGYKISSVSGCGGTASGNTYTTGAVTGDCTVTANFVRVAAYWFQIRRIIGRGTVSWSDNYCTDHDRSCRCFVQHGANMTFAFTPDTGFHVRDVRVDDVSKGAINSYTFTNVAKSHSISVVFASTYTLSVAKAGAELGMVKSASTDLSCGPECTSSYPAGAMETLTVAAAPGATFDGWSGGGCSGTGDCSVTMNSDTAVTAVFSAPPTAILSVSAGGGHNAVRRADGTLWAWGSNKAGQVGDGTTIDRLSLVQIGTDSDWSKITAGDAHTFVLKKNGTLWAWGGNAFGQLGDGTIIDRYSPVQIGIAMNWAMISAGTSHTVALKTDGSLWAWGDNLYGQLGDGTTNNNLSPVQIGTELDWIAVSSGSYYTVALKSDGTLWAWGGNSYGQLGDGTTTNKFLPVQIGIALDWTVISAGKFHTVALKADGTLWAWGDNSYGQLGDGTSTGILSPVQIGSDINWSAVSSREDHSAALKADGTLWAWGRNDYGQLGDGTVSNRLSPVNIGMDADWAAISLGKVHSAAIKRDGTLWTWGGNVSGQLGEGSTAPHTLPEYITGRSSSPWTAITALSGDGGSVSPSGTTAVAYESSQTYAITPALGYHVVNVVVDGVSQGTVGSYTFANITSNHLIEATFAINTYTITSAAGHGGRLTPGLSILNYGGSLTYSILADSGYYITDVRVDGISQGDVDSYTFADVASNHTIEASFAAYPALTIAKSGTGFINVTSSPAGIYCGMKCTGIFGVDTTVTLTATASPGTTFTGWSGGGCSGTGACTVTLNGDTTVTASFTALPTAVLSVTAGEEYTVSLRADGSLWAWGYNGSGQLGDGTTTRKLYPVQIGTDTNWVAVSAGSRHTVARKADGTLWAWGNNYYGQLGDGTTINKLSPVQVGTDADWVAVSAGYGHTLALKSNGTLWAWGYNYQGQLGDGTTANKLLPIQIGTDTHWIAVSVGSGHSTALKTDGTLWAWGDNYYGQLGDGTTINKLSPVKVGVDADWVAVSAGSGHILALKSNGSLWAWGYNGSGQLGDGTTTNKLSPVQIGNDSDWAGISAGSRHTVAIKTDGTLWARGANWDGRLGDGTTTSKLYPVQIGTDADWVGISAGYNHTAAIKANGTLWTWGNNGFGQLGNGTTVPKYSPVWTSGRDELRPVTITATSGDGGTITPASATVNYGSNPTYTITPDTGHHIVDVKVDGISKGAITSYTFDYITSNHAIEASFAINTYNLIIKKSGTGLGTVTSSPVGISCGTNCTAYFDYGNVILTATPNEGYIFTGWFGGGCSGTGDCTVMLSSDTTVSATFAASYSAVIATALGDYHTVVLKADGTLWSWGANWDGQLGDGTTWFRYSPVWIGTDTDWSAISAGTYHTVALKSNGTLWAWGDNYYLQIGDGTTADKYSPVQIGADANWVSISAGAYHTVAIKADGTLWAWGYNHYGQLGDGTTTSRLSPVQIGTETNWVGVSAGNRHTIALKSDGTLWAWGNNYYGQLGDGTTTGKLAPVKIGTDTDWAVISSGSSHTLALKADGTLWACGYNYYGQLGDGTTTNRLSPIQIGADADWATISGGTDYTTAVKANGTLWAWGYNYYGQLGDGSTTDKMSPVQIGADTDWGTISAGWGHTAAIKNNGTLWTWGKNSHWQLGDGTLTDRYSPLWAFGRDELRPIYTISATASGGGTISPSSVTLSFGGSQGFNIMPDTDYHIVDVKVDGISKGVTYGYTFDYVNSNHTVEASFAIDAYTFTVSKVGSGAGTVTSAPAGIDCGADCSEIFDWGTTVTLTATASAGYTFAGWFGGGCGGTDSCRITVDSDTTVMAAFSSSFIPTSSVSAGSMHTTAIKADGTLWTWGGNWYGALGDGTTTDSYSAVQVGSDTNWSIVSAGSYYTAAIKTDGALWAWGNNSWGQLGDGTTDDKWIPVQVGMDTDWIAVSVGYAHTIAIKSDGTLWAWGANLSGQLGDGTVVDKLTPVQIGADTNWGTISSRDCHNLAIKSDGALWGWGDNSYSQLGDGTMGYKLSPVQIGTDTDWVKISAGAWHTMALKTDGRLWGWGLNWAGELGDPNLDYYVPSPQQIGSDRRWTTVAAGSSYTAAVKTDGTLWQWGSTMSCTLGDCSTTDNLMIGTDINWAGITIGEDHAVALKTDGSLWAWGSNWGGQLGDGTDIDRYSPVPLQ